MQCVCALCTDQICPYHIRCILSLDNFLPLILKQIDFIFEAGSHPKPVTHWSIVPQWSMSSLLPKCWSHGVHPTCNFSCMDSRIQTQGLCSHNRYCVSWAVSQPESLCLLSGSNFFSCVHYYLTFAPGIFIGIHSGVESFPPLLSTFLVFQLQQAKHPETASVCTCSSFKISLF